MEDWDYNGRLERAKNALDLQWAFIEGRALESIVGDVTRVTDLIDGIYKASEEQALGVDQINTAVSQMDKVTQQNAAGAEESASAAEQLSAQANTVKGVVNELADLINGPHAKSLTTTRRNSLNTIAQGNSAFENSRHLRSQPAIASSKSQGWTTAGQANGNDLSSEDFMSMDDDEGLKGF